VYHLFFRISREICRLKNSWLIPSCEHMPTKNKDKSHVFRREILEFLEKSADYKYFG